MPSLKMRISDSFFKNDGTGTGTMVPAGFYILAIEHGDWRDFDQIARSDHYGLTMEMEILKK
jgi:hypothetical protein